MGKRRDERRAMERAKAAEPGVVVFEPPDELLGLEVENPPPPSTVVVTDVAREAGVVTVESEPTAPNTEDAEERHRGVVRFVHSVRLWDVVHNRRNQLTEARTEDFEEIQIGPLGIVVIGHGSEVFVPWSNVKSADCVGLAEVVRHLR